MEKPKNPILRGPQVTQSETTREQERANTQVALSHGAQGAAIIAGIGVALLLLGWLLFYFCLFLRRGYVG
jgi:hypothetical protein